MNALSAKADSFFGHPSYRRDCVQLAYSGPTTFKYHERGKVIPAYEQVAIWAIVDALCERFFYASAADAILACMGWVDLFDLRTGAFSLVCEGCDEGRPSDITDGAGKPVVLEHALHVQAFHSEFAEALCEIVRKLETVFAPQIGNTSVESSDFSTLFAAVITVQLFARKRSLRTPQRGKFLFKESRILNLFTCRECSEMRQAEVNSDSWQVIANLGRFGQFAGKREIPLPSFAFERKCFDFALNFAMQLYANITDMLNAEAIAEKANSVTMTRIEDRVELITAFKAWVTGFFTGFYALKEILEGNIETMKCALQAGSVCSAKPRISFSFISQPSALIIVGARILPFVPEPLSLRERGVIKTTMRFENNIKFTLLIGVCPKSKFIGAAHLFDTQHDSVTC